MSEGTIERRRVIRTVSTGAVFCNRYQVLKPDQFSENGEWEKFGRRYGIKGIHSLLTQQTGVDFEIDRQVQQDLELYSRVLCRKKSNRVNDSVSRI